MTWQSARSAARERAAVILAKLAESPQPVAFAPLSEYPTRTDFDSILGGEGGAGWSFEFFTMVNRAVARELKRAGVEVLFVPVIAAELGPWLRCYGLDNTPEARAQFVALKAAGALYDTPPRHPRSN